MKREICFYFIQIKLEIFYVRWNVLNKQVSPDMMPTPHQKKPPFADANADGDALHASSFLMEKYKPKQF